MKPTEKLEDLEQQYNGLKSELAKVSYLSSGSIYRRPVGASGARCHWTTKLNNKTVSLALSPEQADWLESALNEHRRVKKILAEMHLLSRRIMLKKFPDAERRKPLNDKVMRLI